MKVLASAAMAAAFLITAAAAAPEITVTGGVIRGQALPDGSQVYRAIPYAAPPVGDLRWKPPQPVVPWKGVRDAVNAPHPCMQLNEGWNAAAAAFGSEDCLYLSVHAPKHTKGAKLPVFFWIHGGSNRAGSGYGTADSPMYKRGVVMVGIEYRLGIFGWLASPELSAESPHHVSGGYALLDEIAALKWVRDNIAKFGGDPGNVTIGGQSAGGIDIGQLMRSPLARGLFAKAIQESGTMGAPRTEAQNEQIGSDLMTIMKLPADARGLAELRAAPAAKLLALSTQLRSPPPLGDYDSLWVGATQDGWILPGNAYKVYAANDQAPVPLIIGNNTEEFIVPSVAAPQIIKTVFGTDAQQAMPLYGFHDGQAPAKDPILGGAGTQAVTDFIFRCPSNQIAEWQIANGQKVWRYQFGVARPGRPMVRHNAELDYVFEAAPADASFGSWPPVQQYWANFLKTGDPNGAGLPQWPDLAKDASYMAFTPQGPEVGHDLRGPVCRLMENAQRAK